MRLDWPFGLSLSHFPLAVRSALAFLYCGGCVQLFPSIPKVMTIVSRTLCSLIFFLLVVSIAPSLAQAPDPAHSLRFESVTPSASEVPQYHKVELRVRFSGVVTDFFDPDALNISASVRTPSGLTFLVPGFLASLDARPPQAPEPVWLVRFTPTEPGLYQYTVSVVTPRESVQWAVQSLTCTRDDSPGFVRVSPRDPRAFEFDNGSLFFPVGQNVCWTSDYESYFRAMHAAGENFVRVWICPWNCWLERTDSLGRCDLDAASRLDDILALAQKYDLRVQLVLLWHGLLTDEAWARNPYNLANGGPCRSPADFFTDPVARKLFQRQLRYLVARYSWSPNLFAWELANEIDLADHRSPEDLLDWHREMAHFLLALDPHRSLVTSSAFSSRFERRLFALPDLTFASPHRYDLDPVQSVCDAASDNLPLGKPVFLAEYGSNSTRELQAALDPGGVLLHAALWSSFHSPAAGAAAPWWWDTHVQANNLYSQFAALSAYASSFDRRARRFELLRCDLPTRPNRHLALQGLLDSAGGSLWIYDKRLLDFPRPSSLPVVPEGVPLSLTGLLDGPFDVVFFDTRAGKPIISSVVQCRAGRLSLTLPRFAADLAVSISHQAPSVPAVESPDLPSQPFPLKQ